jgi:leucyl/phenylalanyl-tRNA--protein transferase
MFRCLRRKRRASIKWWLPNGPIAGLPAIFYPQVASNLGGVIEVFVSPTPPPAALPPCRFRFPDPARADAEGLLAEGGDLEPSTLIAAYRAGIFPWPYDDHELLWWSPDPRAILPLDGLHVSRSLARLLRQGRFRVTLNAAFPQVIAGCADREETWITPALRAAYERLHGLGWAHSVEVWGPDGTLAGGLYGVAVGALFSAESMFHRVTDASKVAMVALVDRLRQRGFVLLDTQWVTDHLTQFGAIEIPRSEYLQLLQKALRVDARFVDGGA